MSYEKDMKITKQAKNKPMSKNNNPDGRGGFADNPSNINKKGRPPKGYSITEMMREMLDSKPEVKEAIGKVIAKKALEGDLTAIKTLWQYMDGMPLQKHDVEGNVNVVFHNSLKQIEDEDTPALPAAQEPDRDSPEQG